MSQVRFYGVGGYLTTPCLQSGLVRIGWSVMRGSESPYPGPGRLFRVVFSVVAVVVLAGFVWLVLNPVGYALVFVVMLLAVACSVWLGRGD